MNPSIKPYTPREVIKILSRKANDKPRNLKEEKLETGKILNLDNDLYHACDAITHSKMETFARNPKLFEGRFVTKEIEQNFESDALKIGSAIHCLILEPSEFEKRYIVKPEGLRKPTASQLSAKKPTDKTVEQIKEWKAWEEVSDGKTELTETEIKQLQGMQFAVYSNEVARKVLLHKGFESEVTWRIELEHFYAQCKTDGFIDCFDPENDLIVNPNEYEGKIPAGSPLVFDLKSTASLSAKDRFNFERSVRDHHYYRQEAFYKPILSEVLMNNRGLSEPVEIPPFLFCAVTSNEPYECECFLLPQIMTEIGWKECQYELTLLNGMLQNGFTGRPKSSASVVPVSPYFMLNHENNYPRVAGVA